MIYHEDDSDPVLVKLVDGTWEQVGDTGFGSGAQNFNLILDQKDVPYVEYFDANNDNALVIEKLVDNEREALGDI